jgi:hypothetical protein
MDTVFPDDECRKRRGIALARFATIKHMASNLMRAADKSSMRVKRRRAAWDDADLESIVTGVE